MSDKARSHWNVGHAQAQTEGLFFVIYSCRLFPAYYLVINILKMLHSNIIHNVTPPKLARKDPPAISQTAILAQDTAEHGMVNS